jgi:cytochrome c-type biogenesis protein CcmH
MIGWLALLLLLGAAVATLRWLGVRGGLLQACAAALLFGAVGYAVQGRASLAGSPARGSAAREVLPLTDARHAFFGNFSRSEGWLRMSEGLARSGNSRDAVNLLQNAVRRNPNEPQLWIGLGNALVDHGQGLTPAAELAYRRAIALSPGYPAPRFFYGLALARSGDRAGAVALWRQVLADAPPDASWRRLVEGGVAMLSEPAPAPTR